MPEITPPFADPPRQESPGEQAQRWAGNVIKLLRIVGFNLTPARQDAVARMMDMLLEWLRIKGTSE